MFRKKEPSPSAPIAVREPKAEQKPILFPLTTRLIILDHLLLSDLDKLQSHGEILNYLGISKEAISSVRIV